MAVRKAAARKITKPKDKYALVYGDGDYYSSDSRFCFYITMPSDQDIRNFAEDIGCTIDEVKLIDINRIATLSLATVNKTWDR